jgi:4-amino-4-deoxy-L-arabinose transferase-like glycosyltransferase
VLTLLSFFAIHLALVAVMLVAVAEAGTLVAGADEPLPLRAALGVALWAEGLFLLAALHALRPLPIAALLLIAIGGGFVRGRAFMHVSWRWLFAFVAIGAPLLLLALHPPLAFDETLYHLPFVHSLARSGRLQFLSSLRFPVFPQFQELLAVPAFLIAGDVATHLIAFVELLVLTALIAMWSRRYSQNAAPIAAALFIGSPIVLHLGTILYVDMALALFVTAGFCALDLALTESRRRPLLLSAFFFGAACGVKYLGGYFAVVAFVIVLIARRRDALAFATITAAAALPTTIWLVIATGNPLFPFASRLFGASDWLLRIEPTPGNKLLNTLRVAWDVTFARARMDGQPPMTPLLIAMILVVAAIAIRNTRARIVIAMSAVYLAIFAFLPQDTRYLVPLVPLYCVIVAVSVVQRLPKATVLVTLIALAPGVAYLGWRLHRDGLPPGTTVGQLAEIASRVDGYRALKRAGNASVYVCGAEQLQAYATGPLAGDFGGPLSYTRVLDARNGTLATRLHDVHADYYLIVKAHCPPRPTTGLTLVYEDPRSQLWRVP